MITVACVWVKANVPYSVEYVANLRAMVRKHLTRPHRFVCLTDRPDQLPSGVEPIRIHHLSDLAGWWAKLCLFAPGALSGRSLYLDLDSIVVASLDPIIDFPSPFALVPHAGTFTGAYKGKTRAVVKRFNSSVMVFEPDVLTRLYTDWTKDVADRLHGDQDWIGEQMPDASAMPIAWFPRLSELNGLVPRDPAKVVLCKKPKNTIAADLYPWVKQAWRAA
jgi:hypothetical protein